MVDRSSLLGRLWASVRHDINHFRGNFSASEPPQPGLHTWRYDLPGGQRRLHLRIDRNGAGVLFADVTDVVHLNVTATHIALLALEDVTRQQAICHLSKRFRSLPAGQLAHDVEHVYTIVEKLREPASGCPTCSLAALERAPLFSAPATAPYKVDVALTYGCNNQCSHCYNEPDRLAMPSLPLADWHRILDRLGEIGIPHVIFTGGEATLHPDLPALIAYADQRGHIVGLNTNGRRLVYRPFVQELAEAGLNHVQVTLASCRPEIHNTAMQARSFEQTIHGIDNALSCGLHTITNTTLTRQNMEHVEELIDFLYARGLRTFAMNGMIYAGGGTTHPDAISEAEMAPLLVRVRDYAAERGMHFLWYTPTEYCRLSPLELELGAKRCNAGEYSICIEPNGDVLPCQSYYVSAGNILYDPWDQIWNSTLLRSFRERTEAPHIAGLPESCHDCPDLAICGSGCRIERELRQGQPAASHNGSCAACHPTSQQEQPARSSGFVPAASLSSAQVRSGGSRQPG